MSESDPCPSCGHCPTCGRGGYQATPAWPWPYSPYTPWIPWNSGTLSYGMVGTQPVADGVVAVSVGTNGFTWTQQ